MLESNVEYSHYSTPEADQNLVLASAPRKTSPKQLSFDTVLVLAKTANSSVGHLS